MSSIGKIGKTPQHTRRCQPTYLAPFLTYGMMWRSSFEQAIICFGSYPLKTTAHRVESAVRSSLYTEDILRPTWFTSTLSEFSKAPRSKAVKYIRPPLQMRPSEPDDPGPNCIQWNMRKWSLKSSFSSTDTATTFSTAERFQDLFPTT